MPPPIRSSVAESRNVLLWCAITLLMCRQSWVSLQACRRVRLNPFPTPSSSSQLQLHDKRIRTVETLVPGSLSRLPEPGECLSGGNGRCTHAAAEVRKSVFHEATLLCRALRRLEPSHNDGPDDAKLCDLARHPFGGQFKQQSTMVRSRRSVFRSAIVAVVRACQTPRVEQGRVSEEKHSRLVTAGCQEPRSRRRCCGLRCGPALRRKVHDTS